MERIMVTGGEGLLAHAFKEIMPRGLDILFVGHAEFDLTDREIIERQLAAIQPGIVINTAAYNLVDRCEIERDLSWAVNAAGPETLARICAAKGVRLVHYGTDYVFDGVKKSPYVESDSPNPLNHYAAGKLAGEQGVLRASARHLVLRTSWIFGWHPTQTKTFVHTILKTAQAARPLKSTTDQVSVPTFAPDLAQWTLELLQLGIGGLWHAVNDDGISRFDWTKIILEEAAQLQLLPEVPPVEPVLSSFFNATMRRPDYTVLDNCKLSRQLGHAAGHWRPGLRKMLARMQ